MSDLGVLWARCKAGDASSRCALIEQYAPLATRLSRRVALPGSPVAREDLESAGLVGLIDAVDRYQPERGVPFEAYAVLRIRGAMLDELRAAGSGRSGEHQSQVSLDELLSAGDHRLPFQDDRLDGTVDDLRLRVERAISCLPERQRELLRRYYGEALTLREAGKKMGISEARACQLHGRAIANLRRALVPRPAFAAA